MNIKQKSVESQKPGFNENVDALFPNFAKADVQHSVTSRISTTDSKFPYVELRGLTSRRMDFGPKTDTKDCYKGQQLAEIEAYPALCEKNGLSLYERNTKDMLNGQLSVAVQKCISEVKNFNKSSVDLSAYDQGTSDFASVCYKIEKSDNSSITLSEVYGYLRVLGLVTYLIDSTMDCLDEVEELKVLAGHKDPLIRKAVESFKSDPLEEVRRLKDMLMR